MVGSMRPFKLQMQMQSIRAPAPRWPGVPAFPTSSARLLGLPIPQARRQSSTTPASTRRETMMDAVVLHLSDRGTPNTLKFERFPLPARPAPGYARVELSAVALNKRDHWIALNQYPALADRTVLGSDGVGTLVVVSSPRGTGSVGAAHPLLDKRVLILPSVSWGPAGKRAQGKDFRVLGNQPDNGTFAQYVDVPTENVFPAPRALGDAEAAALPLAGLTAWRAVKTRGGVERGMNVLVTAAGSGVSTFAMQYAVALGAKVWTTSSSRAKIDFAMEKLGVEGGVDYRDEDWTGKLAELVGEEGAGERVMDVVVDSSGMVEQCLKLLRPGGRYVFFGNTTQRAHTLTPADMRAVYFLQLQIVGSTMGSPEEFAEMLQFVQEHGVKPVVHSVRKFSKEGWEEALREMEMGEQQGKIVLTME
ncbi:NAD(P)-binding protein [Calocera cornea HHB12733]|uniref:NAD(P)-binding protein n=1 Tax=Calocera cornea HHB12733 TaxID=1353952 RepID=A0A165I6A7_9BASI|nr:NAD(P)-binding protein [Calocera cornea HHB12733]